MKITEEKFLEYYEQGLKDSEISRLSGDSESTINVLRKKLKLEPNGRRIISDELFLELYNKGKTDTEISSITGCSTSQCVRRREKFGLQKNVKETTLTLRFSELYNEGFNDVEIGKIIGYSKSRVQAYRTKLGLPPVEKNAIDLEQVKCLVSQGKTDKEIANILNYSWSYIRMCRTKLLQMPITSNKPNNYVYEGDEYQVLIGSLLGDGSLQKVHKNGGTVLKITHSEKQKEYICFKQSILSKNCSNVKSYQYYDSRRKIPEYTQYSIYTYSSIDLNQYFYNWYKPNKQIYEKDLFKIEPLGLAIWYMDDGYKCKPYGGCMLCTNSFTRVELELIQKMFKEKFNINVNLNCECDNLVYVPSKEFPKFKALIEPYIIPSMKYKLE